MDQSPLFALASPGPDPIVAARPVGSVMQTSTGPHGLATATFDGTGQYRFRLSRVWDETAGRCVFVMLNPSTADAFRLDATVTRCARFARDWGFGALEVANVFALRSTDPKGLYRHPDPVGDGNDDAIVAAAQSADLVVAAWGVHAALGGRGDGVRALLDDAGVELRCLRLTKDGHPGHPLYVPSDRVPRIWVSP
jgi:hypothetical protein